MGEFKMKERIKSFVDAYYLADTFEKRILDFIIKTMQNVSEINKDEGLIVELPEEWFLTPDRSFITIKKLNEMGFTVNGGRVGSNFIQIFLNNV
jgi:hypothetical protein